MLTNTFNIVLISGKWFVRHNDEVHSGPYASSYEAIEACQKLRAGKTSTAHGERRQPTPVERH